MIHLFENKNRHHLFHLFLVDPWNNPPLNIFNTNNRTVGGIPQNPASHECEPNDDRLPVYQNAYVVHVDIHRTATRASVGSNAYRCINYLAYLPVCSFQTVHKINSH
jgi:hypothetical protein